MKTFLGKTDMELIPLGLGGIPLQRIDEIEAIKLIESSLKKGINFIDTARGYTVSEGYIGAALRELGYPKVFIATKNMARDEENFRAEMEESFRELGLKVIDLYQFHNLRSDEEFDLLIGEGGAYNYARRMQEEGRIRYLGISTHRVDILERAIESELFDTVQFPLNYMESQGLELLKRARKKGIGTIIMKPFAGGALRYKDLALRYLLASGACDVVIPGMDSLAQLEENLAQLEKGPLSQEEKSLIEEEARELGEHFCRRCGYCLPCSVDIDIPTVFLMEGYYSRYDLKDWAKKRYASFSKKASDCIACGICQERCPYELPIIKMMERVESIMEL